ncbi:rhomboid family intramembrane serine protease [Mucilaginibacter robiniae]|uniref:Rhomboid family intramembrane serine protease n=1 Tax=Mucilaginibacter robiniae TaxID=2728022 RepID=A0A7L5E2A1_9SPHI|nr:rhomboid family intramembrane serine protease [Mucilaginibacter robiniae]QJD96439.1 rhomboid family intramembrane serine protease [Mucilaginibacter robiniae]
MEEYLLQAPVASAIFAITIATTLYAFSNDTAYRNMALHPYSVYRGKQIWTILTSGLIHVDWTHLIFNMFSYFFFAFDLERLLGHWQFAILYIASILLSDMPSVYKHKDEYRYYSLGASGAISAVVFSSILFIPFNSIYIFPIPFGIPAIIYGVLYLIYCVYASRTSHDAVNHDAHFYGALSGLVITVLLNHQVINLFLQQVKTAIGH